MKVMWNRVFHLNYSNLLKTFQVERCGNIRIPPVTDHWSKITTVVAKARFAFLETSWNIPFPLLVTNSQGGGELKDLRSTKRSHHLKRKRESLRRMWGKTGHISVLRADDRKESCIGHSVWWNSSQKTREYRAWTCLQGRIREKHYLAQRKGNACVLTLTPHGGYHANTRKNTLRRSSPHYRGQFVGGCCVIVPPSPWLSRNLHIFQLKREENQ